ncbi:vacuolar protein sorting-associated protein [Chloropicon primus]|uniref:Vacuolar protein sorting-associated protein n=1 Tax=Chloropicon primus TaxID=1764295 RepID=A0A5B8MJ91_9CHLO|nr:vacuolar protein sorting-associated protein [Chloropicon primus]|eukprot:QDZ20154.1 vacuolar protein sorting-associated protein [Chloropicon primus]
MLEAWEDNEKEELERRRVTAVGGQMEGKTSTSGLFYDGGGGGGGGDGGKRRASREFGLPSSPSPLSPLGGPQFELELVEGRIPGEVNCAGASNDCVVLGTKNGSLLRYDYSDDYGVEQNRTIVQLSKSGKHEVTRIHLDRSSVHCLAVLSDKDSRQGGGGAAEYAYLNTVTQQPKLLAKLRGLEVESVGWADIHSENEFLRGSGTSTGPVLLGTKSGQFYELQVDDREKKERAPKLLFELPEKEAVFGIEVSTFGPSGSSILVVAITRTRCYFFSAEGTNLEGVFSRYADDGEGNLSFLELPGQNWVSGELHLHRNLKQIPQHLAWMAAPGVFHGQVNLEEASQADAQATYHTFLSNSALLDYLGDLGNSGGEDLGDGVAPRPLSMAVTEYHFILLFENTVKVINRINEKLVHEEVLEGNFKGRALGLVRDESAQVVYLYSTEGLYSFEVRNESQDIWRVYLDKGKYDLALEFARTVEQRNHVYNMRATRAMNREEYLEAAKIYSNVCGQPSFEEVCLKFIEISQFAGLQTFLQERLKKMSATERTQATMVSTWLTEIYLDAINEAYIRHGKDSAEYHDALQHFRSFLKSFKKYLDESTTSWLLSSYGHMEELIKYASLIEDHETVVQNLIQRDRADEAIQVLRKPTVPSSLWYKASPKLFLLEPHEMVDAWMIADKLLDPIKLLPSLLKVSDKGKASVHSEEAVRYLQFCINRMRNTDCRIHNLLLSFLSQNEEEGPLLKYLTMEGLSPSGEPYYDSKFALRLCMKMKKVRCCVQLYSMMHLYEEAVNNALHVDLELAKTVADRPEEDHILRKKLWLVIAQHVIEQDKSDKGENIRKAITFRKETDSLLKVEDILPFFPNFVLIDDFKDAIIQSLEEYNNQIEDLRNEMDEITHGTEALRQDIAAVSNRVVTVPQNETCAKCGEVVTQLSDNSSTGLGIEKYYVFPCRHVFRTSCLVDLLVELSPEATKRTIQSLCANIPFLRQKAPLNVEPAADSLERSCKKLDDILGQECPYCGDLLVKSISKPFISEEEYDGGEFATWEI